MKRSYTYLKGLLTLALAAFTGGLWAAETMYPSLPTYRITSAEYVEVISPVLMPTPAVTSFTVTILYQTGEQRSDISKMVLVDPETNTTIAEDIHDGYSGEQTHQHVYTLGNIPESYAGKKLLVKMTVKCNETGAASQCNVELSSGVTHTSIVHEYAEDKEFFSINFGDSTQASGFAGIYAAEGWNNCSGATGTLAALKMWTGDAAKLVKIDLTYSSATTWGWTDASDAFLDGYLDDGGDRAQITLRDIPFSKYSVIVYTATDTGNAQFTAVSINNTNYVGSATYTEGVGYAVASSERWGATQNLTAAFGTNALRLDGLTGDLTIVGGPKDGDNRGGIAAIQVINTGTLGEIIDAVAGHTVMGYNYPLIFRGTTDANWGTVANWYTLNTFTSGEDVTQVWSALGGETVPGTPDSNMWTATIVDGALLADTITVGTDGYKTIAVPELEGWASKMGAANGVHLVVENLKKVQADSDWRVDETSKITFNAYNTSGNKNGSHNIVCLAENGIEFKTACNVPFNYTLGTAGSVIFTGALSEAQTVKSVTLDLGDSTKRGMKLETRKLIGFGSSSATFNTNNVQVTGVKDGTTAATVKAEATLMSVGDYTFTTESDGLYVKYIAYDNAALFPEVSAILTGDATLSSLNLTGGETTIATITVPDGATLTIDGSYTFMKLAIVCEGSAAVTATSADALSNIARVEATAVKGVATYAEVNWYSHIPFAKLRGFDKIKKIGTADWTLGDLSKLAGYQLEVANGLMLVNTAMPSLVATAENPVLVTGATATLKFNADQNGNRMPNNSYMKAVNGGTIELTGVNPFNGDNGPNVILDGGILKTTATGNGHLKVKSVTLSNGSKILISRAATAYASEGLVIRSGDSAKIIALAGENTIEYRDDGSSNNTLSILNGTIDVAAGATLDVKVPVVTGNEGADAITKVGAGTLVWNGSTAKPIVIAAGELVFNADATPTNTFSGAGTVVADGVVLNLTHATVTSKVAVKNGGTLVIAKSLANNLTVPAGCTVRVDAGSYNEVTLSGVTLVDETAKVIFVLPNGKTVDGVATEEGVMMPSQLAYVWTTTASEANWSAGSWQFDGVALESAPTVEDFARYPVIVELTQNTTIVMDTDVTLTDLAVTRETSVTSACELTIAGEKTLTVLSLSSADKVTVAGKVVINGGTAEAPIEVPNVVEVTDGGTLTTAGYVNLTAENKMEGTLIVDEGATSYKHVTGSWDGGLQGTVTVKSGAKLALAGSDIVNWNGGDTAPLTINVKGELDIGTTRLGLNKKTLNLYAGAIVKGEGDGQGALDYFGNGSVSEINVLADGENTADVTVAAKIRTREGALPTFTVDEGMTAVVSGVIFGDSKIVADGTGTLKLTGANTYTGGTVVATGATLTVPKMSALGAADTEVNEVNIAKGGKVTVTSTGNVAEDDNVARAVFAGEGTVEFNGAGYYVLPKNFKAPAYLINNQADNLTIATDGTYDVGSYSGEKYFRMDYNQRGERAIVITQRADATIASDIVQKFGSITNSERLTDVTVKGVDGATLTLSGAHNNVHFRTLTIDTTGSVNLAGGWKGNVVANGKLAGEGTIGGTLTLADGATLAGAIEVTGDVTVAGALTITHATKAGDTVITCNNANAVMASLPTAPTTLKYEIVDGNTIKLAPAQVTVTIPAAPANTKWYDADGNVVEAGTIAVDPNTDVTLTLKADEGYIFADGTNSTTVTVNAGETGATITVPEVETAEAKAMIGETPYLTFAAALAAADEGDTITLLADVTVAGTDADRVVITKAITIDGNDYTITATNKTANCRAINVDCEGEVTLQNLVVVAAGERGINVINKACTLTLTAVDVTAYNYAVNVAKSAGAAQITITNSALTGKNVVNVAAPGSNITIDGTTLTCIDESENECYATLFLNKDAKGATITATDMTFSLSGDSKKASNQAENGTITIDGSTADVSIHVATLVRGEYWYGFETIDDALATAEAGETITLIRDVTASEIITIEKAITLDGNGKTLASTAGRAINVDCAGAVTIKNLIIDAAERAINIINQAATVTINGVTATADNNAVMIATSAGAVKLSIDGCSFTGLAVVSVNGAGAQVTIANSTIANVDANDDENYGAITVGATADNATVEVSGTTITVMDDSKKVYNFAPTATITGVDEDEVGVVVAMIGEAGYDTIEEAADDVQAGQTIVLVADVTATKALAIAGTIDLNGKKLTADIAGTIKMNGGTFATSQYVMVGADGKYTSTDAVFTIAANATYDMTVTAGTLTLNAAQWWTLEGQTITIGENAAIVIPEDKTLGINGSTIVVNGKATVAGEVQLLSKTSTVKAAADLNVTTTVAGCEVKYVEGVYTVVESIVIEDVIAATPAAEAIKAAMEALGVTEIKSYKVCTAGGTDTGAEADEVAAVLEVFEVTPAVDANGVLSVAYEFGISAMTNVGDTVTITAGVDKNTKIREGVAVVFYVDGAEFKTADSKTLSITANAEAINGKEITVKAKK